MEEGFNVKILAVRRDPITGKHGLTVKVDLLISEAEPEDFDYFIILGGWVPDRLRRYWEVLDFVREMFNGGKIVASICHAPQALISAGVLKGRGITCVSAIKDDVINAGAIYLDEPVVRDGNLISSRISKDPPYFCREIIKALKS